MTQPTRLIAGIIALTGFAVAALSGVAAGSPSEQVLGRAIVAMLALYVGGLPIGAALGVVARDCIEEYKRRNPIPELPPAAVLMVPPGGAARPGTGSSRGNV